MDDSTALDIGVDPKIRREYELSMGKPVGEVMGAIYTQWCTVRLLYDRYKHLFQDSNHIEMQNAVSPIFPWLQGILWEYLLLRLTNITDHARYGDHECMSTMLLRERWEAEGKPRLPDLKNLTNRARKKTEFARSWRNRWIAHSDSGHWLGERTLRPASLERVKVALDSIHAILEFGERIHSNGSIANEVVATPVVRSLFATLDLMAALVHHAKSKGWADDDYLVRFEIEALAERLPARLFFHEQGLR